MGLRRSYVRVAPNAPCDFNSDFDIDAEAGAAVDGFGAAAGAIASNESFGGWTRTFTDPRLCAVVVDRLTFNGTFTEAGTDSCRLAGT